MANITNLRPQPEYMAEWLAYIAEVKKRNAQPIQFVRMPVIESDPQWLWKEL